MTPEDFSPALQRLVNEGAVEQLRRAAGLMAALGSEDGTLKLDWVEGIPRLLADNVLLEQVEAQAREIWERGIRHIVWSGMGGSVMAVHVLTNLGFCAGRDAEHITIYPLDSTDPAALNAIVLRLAQARNMTIPEGEEASHAPFLRALFADVMMVGVSMGMTSEEPITHLAWFIDLLKLAGLRPEEHLLILTLPDSYLDRFSHEQGVPGLPLQLDGRTGTGGRMSAPTTRVFLLPVALYLTRFSTETGQLRTVLRRAWDEYNLDLAVQQPGAHPFVQLAAALSAASVEGTCYLMLNVPEFWRPLIPWVEQLLEESLGKNGKGIVVFDDQYLNVQSRRSQPGASLRVQVSTDATQPEAEQQFKLVQSYLAGQGSHDRLVSIAASFLGWQLSMALYGYLQQITFAGQPAVENYKARARMLRTQNDPLQIAKHWPFLMTETDPASGIVYTLLAPAGSVTQGSPVALITETLRHSATAASANVSTGYFDFTINGECPAQLLHALDVQLRAISNELLGIPVKLRRAPAAYHSTEQSEMDGPSALVSLRVLTREHARSLLGTYTDTFLLAQAVSTWQAMLEQGRSCFLLVIESSLDAAAELLQRFLDRIATRQG